MPLSRDNTRDFHVKLYAGELETIQLLKRNEDMQASVVRSITLFDCRRSIIFKTGQPIQGDMLSDHRCTWHIPRSELDRTGVDHINMLDRVVDFKGRYWQPESNTIIMVKLFENMINIDCLRVDPPDIISRG